jgi:hypothetical protein
MTVTRRLLLLCLFASPCACDDADPDLDGSDDDGSGDGGPGDDGADSSGGDATYACEAAPRDVVAPSAEILANLTIGDDALAMLVLDPTLAQPSRIDSVRLDGSGRTTLATGTSSITITSVAAHRDTVYFTQRDYLEPIPVDALYRVPIGGGTPEAVGDVALEDAEIFAADDAGIYMVRNTLSPIGTSFERIDPGSGVRTTIGATIDRGGPLQLHTSADRIVFHVGHIGSQAGEPREVMWLPKDGVEVEPQIVWVVDPENDPCYLALTGLFPTPTKIACGFSGVAVRELDGTSPQVLIEPDILSPLRRLVVSDGESLYLSDSEDNQVRTGHLLRIRTDDATVEPIACDVAKIAWTLQGGVFPNQTEFDIVVGDAEVFWIEEFWDGTAFAYSVRAAAK